jgi:two-component system response regulator YesN
MNKIKVMLVEDEITVREGYKKLFDWEGHGFTVACEAGDGLSAVSLASQYTPDIILMDINIPLLSGLDAIEVIREQLPSAICIIVSGYDEFGYAQRAIRLSVEDYLLKLIKFEELSKIMQKVRLKILKRRGIHREEKPEGKRIYKIISYLNEHLADNICLKILSNEFCLHPAYISHLFKLETGMTYHDYLMSLRIDRAKHLLATTDLSISQIADKLGFEDYRNFSLAFKKFEKNNPSVFRQNRKQIKLQ